MQWAEINGRQRLLVGGKINRFIPNPTWDPVSKPGALDEYFRGRNPKGADTPELFGELDRLADHPEYQNRDARLAVMDQQGVQGAIFLPTLGVGMEQALLRRRPGPGRRLPGLQPMAGGGLGLRLPGADLRRPVHDAGRRGRTRSPSCSGPSTTTPASSSWWAARSWPTAWGARRPIRVYDRFWSLANESGVTVCYHGGDSAYSQYLADWGESSEMEAFRQNPFRGLISANALQDNFANLLAHGHFARYPNLRVASIETGSAWVFHLFEKLGKSFGQTPHAYPEDPRETFKRHVWVSPFYEDELDRSARPAGRRPHPHGVGLPPRRGAGRARVLHQGPAELRLLRRGLPPGHAGQRHRALATPAALKDVPVRAEPPTRR